MAIDLKDISVPQMWESYDDYSSHRELLYLCVSHLKPGDVVVEFGSGKGSTELLRRYCDKNTITFHSFDTDKEWAEKTGAIYVKDFANIEFNTPPTMLFVDGKPGEQRKNLIAKFKDEIPLIVAHDTESGSDYAYKMGDVLNGFKYRLNYCPSKGPHSTVVSETINLYQWTNRPGLILFTIPDE